MDGDGSTGASDVKSASRLSRSACKARSVSRRTRLPSSETVMLGLALPTSEIAANMSSIRAESVFGFLLSLATLRFEFSSSVLLPKVTRFFRFLPGAEPCSKLAIEAFGMVSLLVPSEFIIAARSKRLSFSPYN